MPNKFKILILLLSALFSSHAKCEETIVVGQVLNKADHTPLRGVNVRFKNSNNGMASDTAGYFMLRTYSKEHLLVFSSVGYKTVELRIKPGQSVGTQVEMEEESSVIQEVFVVPGVNPALEMMKKVRLMRGYNDISQAPNYASTCNEQNVVLLSKVNKSSVNKRLFEQLKQCSLSHSDSLLIVPLYMTETKSLLTNKDKKELSKNRFSSPEVGEKLIAQLAGELDTKINFYDNAITLFGKSMISPLANIGGAFYDYYLADSIQPVTGKQYQLRFRTKNSKNLAFKGTMWIDSASCALTKIDAELPNDANINFIHNLRISQSFEPLTSHHWARSQESMAVNMTYALLADSTRPRPDILIKRSVDYQVSDSIRISRHQFAATEYSSESINDRLEQFNTTPAMRTARFIGDVLITGYIPVGIIDIGKVQQIIRVTDSEGLRLTAPFRTNEHLWKNLSIGGYVGHGFLNNTTKYGAMAQVRLPGPKRRVIGVNYMNDFRRVDYNYNDFLFRENPLISADEDISSSILAGKPGKRLAERHEYTLTFANDWNADMETNVFFRSNTLIANTNMPMALNANPINSLSQQSLTVSTRFSFGEKTYDDHLQRIYVNNYKPAIYATLEMGHYSVGDKVGNYAKAIASMRHSVRMDVGVFNYVAEAGWLMGALPYPLLQIPPGSETGGYCTYQYNMMNYMEYVADKYVNLHSELILNGLVCNQLPLIKHLNLREMLSCHFAVGGLSDAHRTVLDIPTFVSPMQHPYLELGVGCTNILRIFTLQVVRRVTDLNKPGISPWGVRICLSLSF